MATIGGVLHGAIKRFLAAETKPKCSMGAGDSSYSSDSDYPYANSDFTGSAANMFEDEEGGGSRFLSPPYHRVLAGAYDDGCSEGEGYGKLDYTVLSVAMWTLALVLVVEVGRHYVDRKAHNRAFLRTVLEGMYSELTTLGIVEFALFLFQQYMDDFDEKIYKVFSKVHFLLFFAAMINALMSVVLAFSSKRISDRMWVQTEELDLNHYIAIREEFERVDSALKQISGDETCEVEYRRRHSGHEGEFSGVGHWFRSLKQRVWYPLLKRKHDRLLVQVRFHELRVHFLQANDLPPKFRVSEYLKKSEQHVFKKMVHISTFAWITVLSFVNLLYFMMGITAYVSLSEYTVGLALGSIYAGLIAAFVPMAWVIEWKMTKIFRQIMKMKMIDMTAERDAGDESSSERSYDQVKGRANGTNRRQQHEENREHRSTHQLDLFWGGDPNYIIGAFQFMQLGYAIAASVLLIFWGNINWVLADVFFVTIVVVCYFFFVMTMARVVPRYTLCTSLGQLVNRRRLQEAMAKFMLEEAKRERRHKLEEEEIKSHEKEIDPRNRLQQQRNARSGNRLNKAPEKLDEQPDQEMQNMIGVTAMDNERVTSDSSVKMGSDRSVDSCKMSKLAELVQTRTQDLPKNILLRKTASEIRRERRNAGMRSVSDGVQLMRQIGGSISNLSLMPVTSVSDSAAAQLMDTEKGGGREPPSKAKSSRGSTSAIALAAAGVSDVEGKVTAPPVRTRPGERRRLRKTQSDLGTMRLQSSSIFGPGTVTPPSEEMKEEVEGMSTHSFSAIGASSKPLPMSTSASTLTALLEDIPSRSGDAEAIDVPVGRKGADFFEEDILFLNAKPAASLGMQDSTPGGSAIAALRDIKSNPEYPEKGDTRRREVKALSDIASDNDSAPGGSAIAMLPDIKSSPESFQPREKGDTRRPQVKALSDKATHNDGDDSDTVNTGNSGESEIKSFGDIPEVAPSDIEKRNESTAPHLSLNSRMHSFFLSSKYRFMSGTFGTMFAFFILGMRVEIMLVEGPNEIISDKKSTWHLDAKSSYYLIVSWISLFLLISLLSSTVFAPWRCQSSSDSAKNRTNVKMTIAIASDILLSALCLVLFLWAEYNRPSCCKTQGGDDVCYEFGSRLCGGLGTIEPWTSIIALRVLRFELGRHAVNMTLRWRRWQQSWNSPRANADATVSDHGELALSRAISEPNRTHATSLTHAQIAFIQEHHIPHSLENETGTIVELWKLAVTLYPDIVDKHGEFSGELLQAMLGLETQRNKSHMRKAVTEASARSISVLVPGNEDFKKDSLSSPAPDDRTGVKAPSKTRATALWNFTEKAKPTGDHKLPLLKSNDDNEFLSTFINPNARLIRSMRRCERRLPPILDNWAIVDVVLTNEELVYFDARDADAQQEPVGEPPASPFKDPWEMKRAMEVKEALFATKGGKGLRLRDVAIGRKVVGRLGIRDIDMAKVECLSPVKEGGWLEGSEGAEEEVMAAHVAKEYWKPSMEDFSDIPCQSRSQRWKHVAEHRLKLHSIQGPLYLRFYSDLEDAETYSPGDGLEASTSRVRRSEALLWCKTVARLRGSDELHQNHAHLGEHELRDLIEMIERGGNQKNSKQHEIRKAMRNVHLKLPKTRTIQGDLGDASKKENHKNLAVEEGGGERQDTTELQESDSEKGSTAKEEESSFGLPV